MAGIIPIETTQISSPSELVLKTDLEPINLRSKDPVLWFYYDHNTGSYWVQDDSKSWMRINETSVKRRLEGAAIFGEPLQDQYLVKIQDAQRIDFVGSLAGYSIGFHIVEGKRILVIDEAKPVQAGDGDWPTIRRLIEGMFGHIQKVFLYAWLKLALQNLNDPKGFMPGQVMIFAGPRGCGKSLFQNVITVLFGGRCAHPYGFISGATDFNGELFGAEHLMMEDESPSTDLRTRRNVGTRLKEFTVNETVRCHFKNRTPITLRPKWRMTGSVNDEPENLMVLPPLDHSLEDKIILLKAIQPPNPMPTSTRVERQKYWDLLLSELPAFVRFLENFEIPPDMISERFGVTHYHHPEIVNILTSLSPEQRLLDLIESEIFENDICKTSWQGTALELQKQLTSSNSSVQYEARNLFSFSTACGVYLARLEGKKGRDRITKTISKGITRWIIRRNPSEAG